MYSGLIIKESLKDEKILDYVKIKSVEIWQTDNIPKYWTAITFESNDPEFPERLSKALSVGSDITWYVDMSVDGIKYIVLKDNVLRYTIGNEEEKATVIKKCMELGVDEAQLDWTE